MALWSSADITIPDSDPGRELAAKLERDADLFLVIEDTKGLAASVMGSFDGRRGWIGRLCVRPDRRGEGLATRLMDEVEARLRDKNCEKVNLLVEPTNEAALALYERRGFDIDHLIFLEKWLTRE